VTQENYFSVRTSGQISVLYGDSVLGRGWGGGGVWWAMEKKYIAIAHTLDVVSCGDIWRRSHVDPRQQDDENFTTGTY
jgi:hypothetical protein